MPVTADYTPRESFPTIALLLQVGISVLIDDKWERVDRMSGDGHEIAITTAKTTYWFSPIARVEAGW